MLIEALYQDQSEIVEVLEENGQMMKIRIGEKIYDIDYMPLGPNNYSIISCGVSYNLTVVNGDKPKKYLVCSNCCTTEIEIVDPESRYKKNQGDGTGEAENVISSPMPGKVVSIPFKPGDEVKIGDTVIIVEAMKMQSEYKATMDGIVKEINVKEGDTINGKQPLVVLE